MLRPLGMTQKLLWFPFASILLFRYTHEIEQTLFASPVTTSGLALSQIGTATNFVKAEISSVPTSQETGYVSATEPNQLMLRGETVAVYCENHKEHSDTLCGQSVPHRNHVSLPYRAHSVKGNARCLLWEPYRTHGYTLWAVRTAQEKTYLRYIAQTINAVGETIAVYCENRTELTEALCGQSVPHRKQDISATKPKRLMLFGKRVAV
jgi:hypothetical protein